MRLVDARTGVQWIERVDCLRLLATKQVGRLGFVIGGFPEILPVNYVLDGEAVVFATAPGAKMDGVARSPVVFEVDDADPATRSGWSVVLHGVAREVTAHNGSELFARVRSLPLEPWADGDRPHLVRIVPLSITGRAVGAAPPSFPTGRRDR